MKAVVILVLVLITLSPIECKTKKVNDDKNKSTTTTTTTATMTKEDQDVRNDIDLINIMKDCNETFRIGMSYLEQLNSSGSFPDETDRTPKCYIRCVLETSGVASDEGLFDPPLAAALLMQVRSSFDSNELEDFATSCMDRQETCKCERSYQFIKCIMEKEINKMQDI
ncbi:general odorant-binding protein 84a-like [Battus philenor]|uniref:general odorant-binding protein 84a-like n=1 Tax=Battus philenor TaxID=42288 RepID=UPI0035D0A34F